MPKDPKPREKLLETQNPKKLDTEELMAILLGHGTKNKNVFELSDELVEYIRGHVNESITIDDLTKISGIGETKALQVIAALELGRRFKWMTEKLKVHNIGNGQIIQGDCLEVMKAIPKDSIILGFTSPPYHNAINYKKLG